MSNDPVARIVSRAKINLLLSHPFFGNMATGMPVIMTDSTSNNWCLTAATDGKFLYFNREWVKSHTLAEIVFVVAHEILHAIYDHLNRRQRRNPEYYNMAGDYVINATLVEGNVGTMPSEGLLSKRYTSEWTTEAVYDDLLQKQVKIEMPLDQHIDGKGGTVGDKGKGKGDKGKGKGDKGDKGDSSDGDGDNQGDGSTQASDGKGGSVTLSIDSNGPPSYTDDELEEIRQELTSRAQQALQAAQQSNSAGCIPAGVRRMLKELTEPVLDWRTMLDATIRSQLPCDFTLSKLSRYEISGFILPAEDDDYVAEADIWIDTSGSMGDELLREILSEVKGIMTTFGQFHLRVGCFDAKAYEVHEFNERNIDELDDFKLEGGGGTIFGSFWKAMSDVGRVPEQLCVFTDGMPCDSWGNGYERYCETLWVIHGSCRATAPFGLTVYYEDAKKS